MGVFKDTSHPLKGAVDEVGIPIVREPDLEAREDECIICYCTTGITCYSVAVGVPL